jgi:hypothetical protein
LSVNTAVVGQHAWEFAIRIGLAVELIKLALIGVLHFMQDGTSMMLTSADGLMETHLPRKPIEQILAFGRVLHFLLECESNVLVLAHLLFETLIQFFHQGLKLLMSAAFDHLLLQVQI